MGDAERKILLLVEDEAIIAIAEASLLKKNGYEVLTAYSGPSAIETAQKRSHIDLVLMDIDLGAGMDGPRAAEIIMSSVNIPVLFLSSHTEPEIVAKTEGISSLGYVLKNSGDTVLLASIRMALKLHASKLENQRKSEELERANGELRRSEAEFRGLFETGPVAVGMLVGRKFFKVNAVMRDTFGYAEEEMIGRTTRMLYTDDAEYARMGRELYEELRLYGRSVQETVLKKKDGTVLDVLICARPLDPEAPDSEAGVATTVLDISGQRRLEAELRKAKAELAAKEALSALSAEPGVPRGDPRPGGGEVSAQE
jgi:PAS domain S-box-containing protein